MLRRTVLYVFIASMLTAPVALAQDGGRDLARRHYAEGQRLFQAGQFDAALRSFQAAYQSDPHPVSLKSQGECLARLGRAREAISMFERYLSEAPAARDAADVRRRIQELQSRGGRIYIVTNPAGAAVTLDGRPLRDRTPANIEVPTGRHSLAVQMPGYQTVMQQFDVASGEARTIQLALVPEGGGGTGTDPGVPGTPPAGGGGARITTPVWVMIGLTGAALLTGIITGSLALSDQGDFDDLMGSENLTLAQYNEATGVGDSGRTKALIADISFGVAGAAALTGIVLFFVDYARRRRQARQPAQPGYDSPSLSISPAISQNGGGIFAIGRW